MGPTRSRELGKGKLPPGGRWRGERSELRNAGDYKPINDQDTEPETDTDTETETETDVGLD